MQKTLEDAAAKVGLIINCKKMKVLACGKILPLSITLRDDSPIEHVSDFKYLGSWIRTIKRQGYQHQESTCHKGM